MRGRLIYVELKSGFSGNGPAWIGVAGGSKTGSTVYFNGQAFRSMKGSGFSANYFDIETGEEYWISGVKKNAQDRHRFGGGNVLVDSTAVDRYLHETGQASLPRHMIQTTLAPSEKPAGKTSADSQKLDVHPPRNRGEAIKRKG